MGKPLQENACRITPGRKHTPRFGLAQGTSCKNSLNMEDERPSQEPGAMALIVTGVFIQPVLTYKLIARVAFIKSF